MYRETLHGYKIKGEVRTVFNGKDSLLNGQGEISGFVYSRQRKQFSHIAKVTINGNEISVDEKGYFSSKLEPGEYTIVAKSLGDTTETLENVEVERNDRIIIIFELGTAAIY